MRLAFLGFAFALLALPSAAIAQVQINQKFVEQGPAPSTGPFCVIGTGDAPPQGITCPVNPDQNPALYGTNIGAVQAVAPDPSDSNTIYVGAVNGGVWVTRDGGANWSHLTDNEVSLSITSLVLDPTDDTHQTLLAGTGLALNNTIGTFSNPNSFFLGSGGLRSGLLYSQDGGVTWTNVGADAISNSVIAAAAVGQTLLAGTSEISPFAPSTFEGGLYSSTDPAHQIWTQIKPNGVDGPVTSIALDPLQPQTVYVALTAHSDTPEDLKKTAIYVSNDAGATWSPNPIFDAAISNGIINDTEQTVIKLATAPNASGSGTTIAAAVINLSTGTLTSLFYSDDGGQSWRQTAIPFPEDLNPEMAAPRNFAVTIDPSNPQFVYVSGDEEECPFGNNAPATDQCSYSSPVFRIDANLNTVVTVNDENTQNGSAVHADSRSLALLPNGDLILVGDGGVYLRTQPQTSTGIWKGLNNLSAYNSFAVGYDAVGKRLITAAQDSGVTIQSAQNSKTWNAVVNFDGVNAFVNDVTLASQGLSVFYATSQGLGTPTRIILDEQGRIRDEQGNFVPLSSAQITCEAGLGGCFFGTKVTCNGGNECYDEVAGTQFSSGWINNKNDPTLMALGGRRVYVTQDPLTDLNAATVDLSLVDLPPPSDTNINSDDAGVTAMAYGTSDNQNVLLAGVTDIKNYTDEGELWLSTTGARPMERLGAYHGQAPTGIVFDQLSQDRFYVADSVTLWGTQDQGNTIDAILLPQNLIRPTSVEFINNNGVDALLVGGLSQTAKAQSPIAYADSNNGVLTDLIPFGSALPNVQVSKMSYNPLADVLAVGTFGRGVWTLYDVTSYFSQAEVLQFGLANNDSKPDAHYLTDGTVLGGGGGFVRPLIKYGTGTLTIAGNAGYTGATTILGGMLAVNGSIASSASVAVNAGGALAGIGTVPSTTVLTGGALSPGNGAEADGTLSVAGSLLFQPGSLYFTQVAGNSATSTGVTGTATLAGTEIALFQPGSLINSYTILSAAGGRTGTFDTFDAFGLPSFVSASLGYTPTDVTLDLASQIASVGGLTRNQTAVGSALDEAFNSGGGIPDKLNAALFDLPASGLPSAMDALSGEVYATTAAVLANDSRYLRDSLVGRLMQAGYSGPGTQTTALGTDNTVAVASLDDQAMGLGPRGDAYDSQPQPDGPNLAFWTRAFGAWANFDGNANVASASRQLGGFVSGMDAGIGTDWRIGAATGLSQSSISVDARHSAADVVTTYLAAYAGGSLGPVVLRTGGAWGWSDIDTSRAVIFPGFYERERSSYGGNTGQVFGEVAYPILIGPAAIEPFGGFAFVHVSADSFHERGDVAALRGTSEDDDVSYSTLGLRVATTWHVSDLLVVPHASAVWQHAYGDLTPDAALAFASTGVGFVITGVPLASDSALIDIGLDLNLDSNITLGVSYAGQFASEVQDNAVKGRFTWLF